MLVPIAGPTALVAKSAPSVFNELPGDLQNVAPAEESQILDSSGAVIAHFYDKQRIVVPSANISDVMKRRLSRSRISASTSTTAWTPPVSPARS